MEKINSVFITFIVLLVGIFSIMIYKNNNMEIMDTEPYWNIYDISIKNIENNMNSITEPNGDIKWGTLKNIDIDDEEYLDTLNSLVADVRMCYLGYTDEEKMSAEFNSIKKYRNKTKITKRKLLDLNATTKKEVKDCSTRLEKYNVTTVSNDKELQSRLLTLTNNIIKLNSKMFAIDTLSYNELLLRKLYELHLVEDMSSFLVSEYSRLK